MGAGGILPYRKGRNMFRDHIPGDDKETRINTNDASIMLVCINGYQENRPYGVIVNYCLPAPVYFTGIHELILRVDEVCEQIGAPMRTMEPRFLSRAEAERYQKLPLPQEAGTQSGPDQRAMPIQKRLADTAQAEEVLIIHVLYRQHASMQGRLHTSFSGQYYVSFRSALELMRMLAEVEEVGRTKGTGRRLTA